MKKKVILKRIFHRDNLRIAIFFDYDDKLRAIVRTVINCAYSSTLRCFYVDDSEENLKRVLKAFKDHADIDISALVMKGEDKSRNEADNGDMPQPETILTVAGTEKEESSQEYLHDNRNFGAVEFRISEKEGLLVIKFLGRYDPVWVDEMRTYGRCYYDRKRKEWLLGWSKLTCDSLADYFSGRGITVNVRKQVVSQELINERKRAGDEIRGQVLGQKGAGRTGFNGNVS